MIVSEANPPGGSGGFFIVGEREVSSKQ